MNAPMTDNGRKVLTDEERKEEGKMDRIDAEELKKTAGVTELDGDALEKVSGGFDYYEYCHHLYDTSQAQKLYDCLDHYSKKQ